MKVFNLINWLVFVTVLTGIVSCGGGVSNEDGTSTLNIDVPLNGSVKDVVVNAGAATDFVFVYDLVPLSAKPSLTGLTIDLNKTLSSVKVNFLGENNKPSLHSRKTAITPRSNETANMYVYVASAQEQATVCDDGERFGPYQVKMNNASELESVEPGTATATQSALSIMNYGSFALCLRVESPVKASFDIEEISGEVTKCDIKAEDLAGHYIGKYTCRNSGCSDNVDEDISLSISQNGYSAEYFSGNAHYEGTVCGHTFRHDGGEQGAYKESGTFILSNDGKTATKTSSWQATDGSCSGSCSDTLKKYVPGEFE